MSNDTKRRDDLDDQKEALAEHDSTSAAPDAPALVQPDSLPERDPSRSNAEQGLYRKFDVRRTDGSGAPGGKHDGCEYFVLDMTHDPHAAAALAAYAAACATTHPALSADLRARYAQPPANGDAGLPHGCLDALSAYQQADVDGVMVLVSRQALDLAITALQQKVTLREVMPWNVPQLCDWSIVGMNHYSIDGQRRLFVSMAKDGRCIKAEGADERGVFQELAAILPHDIPATGSEGEGK